MAISSTSCNYSATAPKWTAMDPNSRFYKDFASLKAGTFHIQKVVQGGPVSQFLVVFRPQSSSENSKPELYQRHIWKKTQHEVSAAISKWKLPVSSSGVSSKHSLTEFFKKTFCLC